MFVRRLPAYTGRSHLVPILRIMFKHESPFRDVEPPLKRRRFSSSSPDRNTSSYGSAWDDWPAPRVAMEEARHFVREVYGFLAHSS